MLVQRIRATALGRSHGAELPLVAVTALAAAATIALGGLLVAYRWELTVGSEFMNVFHADRLAHGDGLYRAWGHGISSFPVYFPGFYVILAPFTWIAGSTPIWIERLASLFAFIGIAVFAGLTARRLGASALLAVSSGLALFTFIPSPFLIGAVRPDVFAGLFAAGALYALTVWEDERGSSQLVLAGALCAAIVLTRQSYVAVPAALVLAVALRDRRAGIRMALGAATVVIVALALTQVLSSGAFLDDQRAFASDFSLGALADVLKPNLLPFPDPVFAVAVAGFAIGLLSWRRGVRAATLAWLGAAISLLAAVKVGASGNYLLPLMWASCVLLGPTLELLRPAGSRSVAVASGILALLLLPHAVSVAHRAIRFEDVVAPFEAASSQAVAQMRSARGPVFGDRFDLVEAAGQTPTFEVTLTSQMEVTGKYDPVGLASALRHRRYAMVQSSFDVKAPLGTYQGLPNWPPSIAAAVAGSYCQSWHEANVWLYRPCGAVKAKAGIVGGGPT
jgi:hypothetical protein